MRKKIAILAGVLLLVFTVGIAGALLFIKSQGPVFSRGLKLNKKTPAYSAKELKDMTGLTAAFASQVEVTLLSNIQTSETTGTASVFIETPDLNALITECVADVSPSADNYSQVLQEVENTIQKRLEQKDYHTLSSTIQLETLLTDGIWLLQYNDAWYEAIEGGMISLLRENARNLGGIQ